MRRETSLPSTRTRFPSICGCSSMRVDEASASSGSSSSNEVSLSIGFPAGVKLLVQAKYLAMQSLAELLAIAGCRHGITEHDGCANRLLGQQIENVGKQCHIAPPADCPLDGAIIQFVADATGRHLHTGINGGLQHGGVKAQDALSIGRGALGKEHNRNSAL